MKGLRFRLLMTALLVVCAVNIAASARSRPRSLLPGQRLLDSLTGQRQDQPQSNQQNRPERRQNARQQQQQPALPPNIPQVEALSETQVIALCEQAIDMTRRRYLDSAQYTPWQMMHGAMALRHDFRVLVDGKPTPGLEFISSGPRYRGEYWFERTPHGGRGHPFSVPYAFEGHINQFPALLSTAALPLDHEIKVEQGTITIADIVRNAQMTVNSNEEITWTLWFLTQYVSQDANWVNQQGQRWSMADLVRLQVQDPVYNAPCGGTHGLFALAFARNSYMKSHGRLNGVWLQAEYKLRQHIELARQLQNPDGSFSTQWFRGRGFSYDYQERLKSSGHMLEWLMMALPRQRLNEPWVRRAVQCVAGDLIRSANQPVECGPMYHAVHAVRLYHERVAPTPPTETQPEPQIARPTAPATRPGQPPAAAPSVADAKPIPVPAESQRPRAGLNAPKPAVTAAKPDAAMPEAGKPEAAKPEVTPKSKAAEKPEAVAKPETTPKPEAIAKPETPVKPEPVADASGKDEAVADSAAMKPDAAPKASKPKAAVADSKSDKVESEKVAGSKDADKLPATAASSADTDSMPKGAPADDKQPLEPAALPKAPLETPALAQENKAMPVDEAMADPTVMEEAQGPSTTAENTAAVADAPKSKSKPVPNVKVDTLVIPVPAEDRLTPPPQDTPVAEAATPAPEKRPLLMLQKPVTEDELVTERQEATAPSSDSFGEGLLEGFPIRPRDSAKPGILAAPSPPVKATQTVLRPSTETLR